MHPRPSDHACAKHDGGNIRRGEIERPNWRPDELEYGVLSTELQVTIPTGPIHMHTLKLSAPVASEVVGARATAIWLEKASPAARVPEVTSH